MASDDNRFRYRAMTGQDLAETMSNLAITSGTIARIVGVQRRTVNCWLKDEKPIPQYVWVLMFTWTNDRKTLPLAREAAAQSIEFDIYLNRPWPYLDGKSPEQIMEEEANAAY